MHLQALRVTRILIAAGFFGLVGVAILPSMAHAAEFFVGKTGNDQNDGRSPQKAFLTINKGVQALAAGDTLTIGPGEYAESVTRDALGSLDAETILRAAIPGTVLLRGDVSAPVFQKVPGYDYIYMADFDRPAQAVNELDTFTILQQVPFWPELEFRPGAMHYDEKNKKLYIASSDLQPPSAHRYTVSVLDGSGLWLNEPTRVIIDGLAFTGFNNYKLLPRRPKGITFVDAVRWGLMMDKATQCVIKNSAASFNGNGIGMRSTEKNGGNLIEKCEAFANYSQFTQEGANIVIFEANNDVVRDCVAYIGTLNGIRFYGSSSGTGVIERCLAWGHDSNNLTMKGADETHGRVTKFSVGLGKNHISGEAESSILGSRIRFDNSTSSRESWVALDLEANLDYDKEFADPQNFDFRLQPTSRFRAKGPNGLDRGAHPYKADIFYVSEEGSDAGDGLSVATAWKTIGHAVKQLKAGETLYLLPGHYKEDINLRVDSAQGNPVRILGRGREAVILDGSFTVENSAQVELGRLTFTQDVAVRASSGVHFFNCSFNGSQRALVADRVSGLKIDHCAFTRFSLAGLTLSGEGNSAVFLTSNIFNNLKGVGVSCANPSEIAYSDYNAFQNEKTAWSLAEQQTSLSTLPAGLEKYSSTLSADFLINEEGTALKNPLEFVGIGRLGKPAGVFLAPTEKAFSVSAPKLHSVSNASANLEWTTSLPGNFEVAWGDTPAMSSRRTIEGNGLCTFSITGLKPDKEYFFQIVSIKPDKSFREKGFHLQMAGQASAVLSFKTSSANPKALTYHVSPEGSDQNDGLSAAHAWKTLGHAAAQVNAGDTVLIGKGIYRERVRIRATGTKEAPITFKAAPGQRPTMDGDSRNLSSAFLVHGKEYLAFDGLTFQQFGNQGHDSAILASGVFQAYQSNHLRITRCFSDGRGFSYAPWFLVASQCADLLVENCVIINSFNALFLTNSPDAVIQNNVFLRPNIAVGWFRHEPGEKITFRNNIVTDSLPVKSTTRLFDMTSLSILEEGNNCYWVRLPAEQRMLFSGSPDGSLTSLAEFLKSYSKGGSIVADPKFATLVNRGPIQSDNKLSRDFDLLLKAEWPLDFPALFTEDPQLKEKNIGLSPAAFVDIGSRELK